MDGIEIETPAKLNVRLKITGRRPDGYHTLVSVMIPVTLTDRLEIRPSPNPGIEFSCAGGVVPAGEDNLVHRAARAFFSEANTGSGVSIRLEKRIPVAAGLGGGSSDAAATLRGLNALWPGRVSPAVLHRLATSLGADVPFFLDPVPAVARGIGDVLEPLVNWPDLWYVVVNPPIAVSTAWVYGRFRIELTTHENDCTFEFLKTRGFSVSRLLENDLEAVTETRFPVIGAIREALLEAGAEGALMTGSGPTVFGIYRTPEDAEKARKDLISRNLGKVFLAGTWEEGGGKRPIRMPPG